MSKLFLAVLTVVSLLSASATAEETRRFLCRCYAEPNHRFCGDLHVNAKNMVEAARLLQIDCKARAWGNFGSFNWSMDPCFPWEH